MKYCHSEVMKNQVGKTQLSCPFYLVILSRYFLEHIVVIKAENKRA